MRGGTVMVGTEEKIGIAYCDNCGKVVDVYIDIDAVPWCGACGNLFRTPVEFLKEQSWK